MSPLLPVSVNIQPSGENQAGQRFRFLGNVTLDGGVHRIPNAVSLCLLAGVELLSWHSLKVDFLSYPPHRGKHPCTSVEVRKCMAYRGTG